MITVELNENTEYRLRAKADAEGVPAEAYARELLESALAEAATPTNDQNGAAQSAREVLADYIGAIDSSTYKADSRYRSAFGEAVEEKYTHQGITLPEWER